MNLNVRGDGVLPDNRMEHDEVWRADAPYLAAHGRR